ncbi:MAG: hypothetical protein JO281_14200 [Pseudonocardiales bacterium]|nr:hypothetical protein [Pseudonocardiales bacterium]
MAVPQTLSPGRIELEFGVKLAGAAGAIIAKTAAEGHFTVKLELGVRCRGWRGATGWLSIGPDRRAKLPL